MRDRSGHRSRELVGTFLTCVAAGFRCDLWPADSVGCGYCWLAASVVGGTRGSSVGTEEFVAALQRHFAAPRRGSPTKARAPPE
jgi:hypothetical protein